MAKDQVRHPSPLLLGKHHLIGGLTLKDRSLEGPDIVVGLGCRFAFRLVEDFADSLHLTLLGHGQEGDFVGGIGGKDRGNRPEL